MNDKSPMIVCLATSSAFLLLSCAPMPPLPELPCTPDSRGSNKITYGITNSKTILQVKETVKVKKDKGLVFKLNPKGGKVPRVADFKDATVRIKGKSGSGWITLIEGTYNGTKASNHRIGICADAAVGTYEYEVEVVDFGNLDPRVIVEPQ